MTAIWLDHHLIRIILITKMSKREALEIKKLVYHCTKYLFFAIVFMHFPWGAGCPVKRELFLHLLDQWWPLLG